MNRLRLLPARDSYIGVRHPHCTASGAAWQQEFRWMPFTDPAPFAAALIDST